MASIAQVRRPAACPEQGRRPARARRWRRTTPLVLRGVTREFGRACARVDGISLSVAAARSMRCSARTGPARRRCSIRSPATSRRLRAPSISSARTSPPSRRTNAYARGCAARTSRRCCFATCRCATTCFSPCAASPAARYSLLRPRAGHASRPGHRGPARARAPLAHRRRTGVQPRAPASSASSRSAWRWPARPG
jgi:hypothetical protein